MLYLYGAHDAMRSKNRVKESASELWTQRCSSTATRNASRHKGVV